MSFIQTPIKDLLIFEPKIFNDDRGYFFESYNHSLFVREGLNYSFVQDNESFSTIGTIRGLHFQRGSFAQTKLVRVLQGIILDVAVDLRPNSSTYGKHFSVELSSQNKRQLLIPKGFAHGFSVLSETAQIAYKCDNPYFKESEGGIRFDDPTLDIDWRVPKGKCLLSDKDKALPFFYELNGDCV